MIPKPLERVDAADIDLLLGNSVPEGRTIDYKRDLPGVLDADKKEFLADVSSFANTVGGDLIIGVEEADGVPTKIVGIASTDLDAEVQRLDSIILSGLDPRIRHAVRSVRCSGSFSVLVIRIEQSWIGPHRVILKGHDKFYARNSSGKYALDVEELRQAFLHSATLAERIRAFRSERLIEIGRGRTPIATLEGAKLVLHFVPHEAFSTSRLVDVMRYFTSSDLLPTMGREGWGHRMTLEGVLTYTPGSTASPYYTHLYRNGVIEAVDATTLNRQDGDQWIIPSTPFEEKVLKAVADYLKVLRDLEVAAPVYVFMSLLGVKNRWMGVSPALGENGYPIDRDVLQLPETVVMDLSDRPDAIMRRVIDSVWNACGFVGSPNFNDEGIWVRRR